MQAHVPRCTALLRSLESKTVEIMSVEGFFYDDPTLSYEPLPDHDLNQSQCYQIMAENQGFYYCKLHPEIKIIIWNR